MYGKKFQAFQFLILPPLTRNDSVGRFYAIIQMKMFLVYLLANFDVKESDESVNWRFNIQFANASNTSKKISVRRRQ
jgi:hypothetical protein